MSAQSSNESITEQAKQEPEKKQTISSSWLNNKNKDKTTDSEPPKSVAKQPENEIEFKAELAQNEAVRKENKTEQTGQEPEKKANSNIKLAASQV